MARAHSGHVSVLLHARTMKFMHTFSYIACLYHIPGVHIKDAWLDVGTLRVYSIAHATRKIIIYVRDVFDVSNLHLISIFFLEYNEICCFQNSIPSLPSWPRANMRPSHMNVCKEVRMS